MGDLPGHPGLPRQSSPDLPPPTSVTPGGPRPPEMASPAREHPFPSLSGLSLLFLLPFLIPDLWASGHLPGIWATCWCLPNTVGPLCPALVLGLQRRGVGCGAQLGASVPFSGCGRRMGTRRDDTQECRHICARGQYVCTCRGRGGVSYRLISSLGLKKMKFWAFCLKITKNFKTGTAEHQASWGGCERLPLKPAPLPPWGLHGAQAEPCPPERSGSGLGLPASRGAAWWGECLSNHTCALLCCGTSRIVKDSTAPAPCNAG